MGAFWESWELWMKMVFVLGVGIVIVVVLGCMKLAYDRYRLNKFTKVIEAQGDNVPQMKQRRGRRMGNDIPFGVRALQSGVEVDGVWISRPTSAATSPKASRPGSPTMTTEYSTMDKGKAPDRSHVTTKPAYAESTNSSSSSKRDNTSPDRQFERATGAEKIPSSRTSRNVSPGPMPRPSYKPRHSSHLRFSSHTAQQGYDVARSESSTESVPDRSDTSDEYPRNPSHQPAYYRPKRQSPPTSHPSSPLPFVQPRRSEVENMPFESHSGVDLSYLSPRRSLAAESGLLLPKSRNSSVTDTSARATPQPPIVEADETPDNRETDSFISGGQARSPSSMSETEAPSYQSFVSTDPSRRSDKRQRHAQ